MLIDRSSEMGYPGSEWRPGTLASPESQSEALSSHPNAVMVQWYQAYSNPSYGKAARSAPGQDAYLRDLQTGPFWAILSSSERAMKRFFPEGSWASGDIALTYDESAMDVSIFDWVVPVGAGTSNPGVVDAATFLAKETVIRAATTSPLLTGTVSSAGSSVIGVGTQFTSQLHAGDVLVVAGGQFVVQAIADDTHLTLTAPPSHNWSTIAFARAFDRVINSPIARVTQVRDTSTIYLPTAYSVAADLGGIEWLNPVLQPAPGAQYSLSYHYSPTYQVTEYGQKGRVVRGRPELSVVLCQLLRPDSQKR